MKLQFPVPAAFSLIEVVLSLAILAVGMTGVLALLPVGLDSARQVHAETIASQVVRGALADFATNGFSLQSYGSVAQLQTGNILRTNYYTQEGVATNQAAGYFSLAYIKGQGGASDPSCRYFVRLAWPAAAATNSPIYQSRTFVTDVIRNF